MKTIHASHIEDPRFSHVPSDKVCGKNMFNLKNHLPINLRLLINANESTKIFGTRTQTSLHYITKAKYLVRAKTSNFCGDPAVLICNANLFNVAYHSSSFALFFSCWSWFPFLKLNVHFVCRIIFHPSR